MSDERRYELARKRIKARFDLYNHAAVYVVIMALLVVLNYLVTPGRYWVIWPLVFWGVALALHGTYVLLMNRRDELIDKLTQEELEKDQFGR